MYVALGANNNYFPGWRPTISSTYNSPSGEELRMDVHYARRFISPYVEFGIGIREQGILVCSFVKFYGAGKVISGDYRDSQNGKVISADHVSEAGSRFTVGLRFGFSVTRGKNGYQLHSSNKHSKYHSHDISRRGNYYRRAVRRKSKRKVNNRKENPPPAINSDNVKSYKRKD